MITPHWLPLTLRRNDNPWRHRVNVMATPGVPLDMTGYRGRMQIRQYGGVPGDPMMALSVEQLSGFVDGNGAILTFRGGEQFASSDSANGSRIIFDDHGFEIMIAGADLVRFPSGNADQRTLLFSYDLLIQPPGGDENAWYEGDVLFREGVTRPYSRQGCPPGACKYGGDTCVNTALPSTAPESLRRWCLWDFPPTNLPSINAVPQS